MTIYLVRHGLAAAGVEDLDPGLAPLGHEQARAAAQALAPTTSPCLVVSPLRRTRETARAFEELLGLQAEVRADVGEVFDPTMSQEERRNMIGPFMAGRWSEQSETLRAWRKDCVEAILRIGLEASAADADAIIVSHYIAICVAVGEALGDDRVVPVPIANCSITSMGAGHGGLSLLEAGATSHLRPELITGTRSALAGRG